MKFGQVVGNVMRKVGDIGGRVVSGISEVKNVMDKTGATRMLEAGLMSNPATAPFGAGLAMASPILRGAQALTGGLSNFGRTLGA